MSDYNQSNYVIEHLKQENLKLKRELALLSDYKEKQQESEEKFRLISEQSLLGLISEQSLLGIIILRIDPSVKAILSSGYAAGDIINKFSDYGFSEVLTKPYTMNSLIECLNKVLKL